MQYSGRGQQAEGKLGATFCAHPIEAGLGNVLHRNLRQEGLAYLVDKAP